jgi:hypothetical protein
MPIGSVPLEVTQNEDWNQVFGFAYLPVGDSEQTPLTAYAPYSFTNASGVWTIAEAQSDTSPQILQLTSPSGVTFSTGVVSGISVGTISLALTAAQTKLFPVGDWFYNVLVTSDGLNTYYLSGPFTVVGAVGF